MRSKLAWLAAFSIALISSRAMADDVADVRQAVRSFGEAIIAGDSAKAKENATASSAEMIDSIIDFSKATKALNAACEDKFKEPFNKMPLDSSRLKEVDDAKVTIDGDKATLDHKPEDPANGTKPARGGMNLRGIHLLREGGQWKVDMVNRAPSSTGGGKMMKLMAKINNETAADVNADKFKSMVEVRAAHTQKMREALQGIFPGAGGRRPTTQDN